MTFKQKTYKRVDNKVSFLKQNVPNLILNILHSYVHGIYENNYNIVHPLTNIPTNERISTINKLSMIVLISIIQKEFPEFFESLENEELNTLLLLTSIIQSFSFFISFETNENNKNLEFFNYLRDLEQQILDNPKKIVNESKIFYSSENYKRKFIIDLHNIRIEISYFLENEEYEGLYFWQIIELISDIEIKVYYNNQLMVKFISKNLIYEELIEDLLKQVHSMTKTVPIPDLVVDIFFRIIMDLIMYKSVYFNHSPVNKKRTLKLANVIYDILYELSINLTESIEIKPKLAKDIKVRQRFPYSDFQILSKEILNLCNKNYDYILNNAQPIFNYEILIKFDDNSELKINLHFNHSNIFYGKIDRYYEKILKFLNYIHDDSIFFANIERFIESLPFVIHWQYKENDKVKTGTIINKQFLFVDDILRLLKSFICYQCKSDETSSTIVINEIINYTLHIISKDNLFSNIDFRNSKIEGKYRVIDRKFSLKFIHETLYDLSDNDIINGIKVIKIPLDDTSIYLLFEKTVKDKTLRVYMASQLKDENHLNIHFIVELEINSINMEQPKLYHLIVTIELEIIG